MLTRKDFVRMAETIVKIENRDEARRVADKFADYAASDNPRFDYDKFMKAAGFDIDS